MNPCIIILCAVNTCMVSCGAESCVYLVDNCVLVPGVPKNHPIKLNFEAVLVEEPKKKRRYATEVHRKGKYGPRCASPTKAALKKRNKKR